MKFRELQNTFKNYQLITTQNMKNAFADYNEVQLSRWVDKGWLARVRQGQYVLASTMESVDKKLLANEIKNSYISLEYALNYYRLVPEVPHKITSVTTERGETVETPLGNFIYRRIQPSLFTGYILTPSKRSNRKVKIASATKALFDFIYLNTPDEFEELRLNQEVLKSCFDQKKFLFWLGKVSRAALKNCLENFLDYTQNYA